MAYATLADVQGIVAQFTIGGTSKPTSSQANIIISDTADEIDARLGARGLATPVTGPASFLRALALLNAYGAAAAILKSWFPDAVGSGDTPPYAFWETRYQQGLKSITDGSLIPPDVTSGSLVLPSTYLTRNPDSEEDLGDIAEPLFKIGTAF